jgi:site-specific DNA recombinase
LHPNLAELYRQKVKTLREALNQAETRSEAALIIRELVQEIRLHPIDGALQIELVGDLAQILSIANKNPRRKDATGAQLTLVAGARYQRYLQLARGWIPHLANQR